MSPWMNPECCSRSPPSHGPRKLWFFQVSPVSRHRMASANLRTSLSEAAKASAEGGDKRGKEFNTKYHKSAALMSHCEAGKTFELVFHLFSYLFIHVVRTMKTDELMHIFSCFSSSRLCEIYNMDFISVIDSPKFCVRQDK